MKKLKNLWVENRVLFVLLIIVIICLITIISVCISYFFGSYKSSYGERLNGIEDVLVTDEIKNNFFESIEKDELIESANIDTKGKIIYISFTFKDGVTLVEAESKALASLMIFEQKYLDFYDFNFTLKEETTENNAGFLIMGARNVNGNGLVWNNNTEVISE